MVGTDSKDESLIEIHIIDSARKERIKKHHCKSKHAVAVKIKPVMKKLSLFLMNG
jgi:hypothetical protein